MKTESNVNQLIDSRVLDESELETVSGGFFGTLIRVAAIAAAAADAGSQSDAGGKTWGGGRSGGGGAGSSW